MTEREAAYLVAAQGEQSTLAKELKRTAADHHHPSPEEPQQEQEQQQEQEKELEQVEKEEQQGTSSEADTGTNNEVSPFPPSRPLHRSPCLPCVPSSLA
jgi:hypothetical protein